MRWTGEAAPEEARGGSRGGVLAKQATPARGQGGGAAEWNEGDPVDVVGGGEEARFGRNQAEAEAAMVDDGQLRRD